MANEYLKRTPTSTGNTRVWTWSGWLKLNDTAAAPTNIFMARTIAAGADYTYIDSNAGEIRFADDAGYVNNTTRKIRDSSGWFHLLCNLNTTSSSGDDRMNIYINGVLESNLSSASNPVINYQATVNTIILHTIGNNSNNQYGKYNITDVFLIDGQALTPDVFGFYKVGKGYISAGSTQSTDFRPGQWVPKTPRVIKTAINNSGGFGVNGFYLPMNDSNNFGADFHGTPNSIIKLQENLPQPRCRIDGVGDYTGALRDDPFKQYLIYAQPNVSGGLQNGYGDYSHIIRGSGTPKVITGGASGTPTISTTQSLYYGSSLYFDGNDTINVETNDSNYLGRDFTIEFWAWHDPANQLVFNTTPHSSFAISLDRGGSGQTSLYIGNGSVWQTLDFRSGGRLYSQQWNHVAVERYNNAITIYHNGVAQGTTTAYMPTGFYSLFRYGTYDNAAGEPVVGYIQDYRVYSGVAKYKGGFDVPKPYTPVGIATWRAVPDTTANNFATLNPLSYQTSGTPGTSYPILSDGNLKVTHGQTGQWERSHASFGVGEGKWYYEFEIVIRPEFISPNSSENWAMGVRESDSPLFYNVTDGFEDLGDHVYWVDALGTSGAAKIVSNQDRSLGSTSGILSVVNGDIINVAFEKTATTLKVWFGINGTYFNSGNPSSGTTPAVNHSTTTKYIIPSVAFYQYGGGQIEPVGIFNFGQNPSFSGSTTAGTFTDSNSKGLFKYQPPSGFLALCEDNLPTPAISDPGKYFRSVLWTGTGASRNIVGVGFTPDLVWVKLRNTTGNHSLYDAVRGAGQRLSSSLTNAEATFTNSITSFDSTGFSLGSNSDGDVNSSGNTYVAWCWKAGAGTTSTNTNGSITSVVSVNQDAGFSIVSGLSGGSSSSVFDSFGHGLGKTPSFILVKNRDVVDYFYAYHKSLPTQYLVLGATNASAGGGGNIWGTSGPSSSVITTRQSAFASAAGQRFIFYCWAEIEGFSKFGSYVGNGSADGPFVYTGGRPAFVMIKRTDSTGDWYLFDSSRNSSNPVSLGLISNTTQIDGDYTGWGDFLSNGFKIRRTDGAWNASGGTYIFACWMESPFTTANSK
jgi:hypothetical protein